RAICRSAKPFPPGNMGFQEGRANSLRALAKSRKALLDMPDLPTEAAPGGASAIRAEIAGNRLEVIESGEERLRALLALIDGAHRSVKILMYMFNPDRTGERVRDALVAAARRGVEVRLLI